MYPQFKIVFLFNIIIFMHSAFPGLVVSHVAKEWVGGDEDTTMPEVLMTPTFGPVTVASFPSSGPGTELDHGKWFKVKTSSCTLDLMRIHSDFRIGSVLSGAHLNISSPGVEKCGINGFEDETEVFIELDDNDVLGIQVNLRHCLKQHELGVILMEHKVRIEDQAGWLIEKFFLKILQNVDMHAIMNEEKRRQSKSSRWICIPDEDLVNMDAGFSLIGLGTGVHHPNMAESKLNASLLANWTGRSEDGMVVTTNVNADYGDCSGVGQQGSGEDEDDSTAEVTITLDEEREWTLSVQINECINSTGNLESELFASKPMRFSAKMDITEGSIYERLLVVARQYVKKKNLKSDKLKEILKEIQNK